MTNEEEKLLVPACGRILLNVGWGSGYLVDHNLMATCHHVIEGVPLGEKVTVEIDSEKRSASVLYAAPESDCAILKLDQSIDGIKPLPLAAECSGECEWVSYGYPLVTKGAGCPLGGKVTLTQGKDDQQQRVLTLYSPFVAAGMGTPINGFSGSPVLVNGYVVGHLKRVIGDPTMAPPAMKDVPPLPRTAFGLVYATPSIAIAQLLQVTPTRTCVGSSIVSQHTTTEDREEFDLLKKWFEKEGPSDEQAISTSKGLIDMGRFSSALSVLNFAGDSLKANQKRALALAKANKVDKAIKLLEKLRADGASDAETLGLLGGRLKQKWLESKDPLFLQSSFEVYRDAFKSTGDTFTGINAAALALYLGKTDESTDYARTVLNLLESGPQEMDNWSLATRGEAQLLLGDLDQAKVWYSRAASKDPQAVANIAVMRRQARLTLEKLQKPVDALDAVLPIPRTAAFTGHMVDVEGRTAPRFPEEKVPSVRQAIQQKLQEYNIRYGFSSAARGSDIIFIEELLKRGGHPHVFLPFPHIDFMKTSVGHGWDERFMAILEDDRVDVTVLKDAAPEEADQLNAYAACNFYIQRAAINQALILDEKPLLLTVWNGNPGDGKGGTADAVRTWRQELYPEVPPIDISKL